MDPAAEARSPDYWVDHLRSTVRFSDGLATVFADGAARAGRSRAGADVEHVRPAAPGAPETPVVVPSLRHPKESTADPVFLQRSLGRLWLGGVDVDWSGYFARRDPSPGVVADLPVRTAALLDRSGGDPAPPSPFPPNSTCPFPRFQRRPQPRAPDPAPQPQEESDSADSRPASRPRRCRDQGDHPRAQRRPPADIQEHATFLELGFDSLFLAQVTSTIRKTLGLKIPVRQLIEKTPSVDAVAGFLDRELPADVLASRRRCPSRRRRRHPRQPPPAPARHRAPDGDARSPCRRPRRHGSRRGRRPAAHRPATAAHAAAADAPHGGRGRPGARPRCPDAAPAQAASAAAGCRDPPPSLRPQPGAEQVLRLATRRQGGPHGGGGQRADSRAAGAHQGSHRAGLRASAVVEELVARHRRHMADPRTVQGFKPQWKEMVFPIVAARTAGSKIWDLDGNEYIDLVNGYGVTFLGHSPSFVTEAVKKQLDRGVEIGPQNRLVGEVAELVCELTGAERAALCNTGSEAVLAAMRLARTVTGKEQDRHLPGPLPRDLRRGAGQGRRERGRAAPDARSRPGYRERRSKTRSS